RGGGYTGTVAHDGGRVVGWLAKLLVEDRHYGPSEAYGGMRPATEARLAPLGGSIENRPIGHVVGGRWSAAVGRAPQCCAQGLCCSCSRTTPYDLSLAGATSAVDLGVKDSPGAVEAGPEREGSKPVRK